MALILQGSQGLGLSRLSLPFLVGTFFTSNRKSSDVFIGFLVYVLGGWVFAIAVFPVLRGNRHSDVVAGGAFSVSCTALFLLAAALAAPSLCPSAHGPRSTTGPRTKGYILEPPGFFGLNYGRRTPLTTLLGQVVYGATLGGLCQLAGLVGAGG